MSVPIELAADLMLNVRDAAKAQREIERTVGGASVAGLSKAIKTTHKQLKTDYAKAMVDAIKVGHKEQAANLRDEFKARTDNIARYGRQMAALANAIGNTAYKFVVEIAADQWEHELDSKQREALLDHLLTACHCDEDPKSGEFKCSVAKPDIMAFRENVERYGMWFPVESKEEEGSSPVEEMFGIADEG